MHQCGFRVMVRLHVGVGVLVSKPAVRCGVALCVPDLLAVGASDNVSASSLYLGLHGGAGWCYAQGGVLELWFVCWRCSVDGAGWLVDYCVYPMVVFVGLGLVWP